MTCRTFWAGTTKSIPNITIITPIGNDHGNGKIIGINESNPNKIPKKNLIYICTLK